MNTLKCILGAVCILLFCPHLAAQKYDKVKLLERQVPVSTISHIDGFVGQRMEVNRKYLKQFPINRYIDFVVNRTHTEWDWTKAEQHGKWIESAFLSAIQNKDSVLLEKAQTVLERMLASQEPNGYVGATARSYRSDKRPIRGMDPYELYFVFHALMTVHEETGNKEALAAVEKLADYFLKYFGPGKLEFWPSNLHAPENRLKEIDVHSDFAGHGVHYSWEGTLLNDPMARLYELTGKKKYLDWSLWVVNNIDKWSGWDAFSRLDSVADGQIGVDKLQPYVHSHTFHMNFMGFLRLYRITGDKSLLRKVVGAWDDIQRRQMYITGGVSVAEHYEHDYVKPLSGNIIETCATMSWMQLTQMLLELTGDSKYADAMERLMMNHVFAAQDCENGVCRYHTAPNGSKPDGWRGFFHGPDCCTASGHRIISLLPTFMYAENDRSFYINQYLPSSYDDGKGFAFTLAGNYPEEETMTLIINNETPHKRIINLRIPSWCDKASVRVNGQMQSEIKQGEYLALNRKWSKGDKVEICFPMEERWIERSHHSDYTTYLLPKGEIMYNEVPTTKIPYAFMRGPIVYSLDMVWNKQLYNDDLDIAKDLRINTNQLPVQVSKPFVGIMGPAYQAEAMYKGSRVKVMLTPFTNAGQWYRPGEEKPNPNATAFTYAIWMYPENMKE